MTVRGFSLAWLAVLLLIYWLGRMVLQFGLHLQAFPLTG